MLSVIIPFRDERENINLLYRELNSVLGKLTEPTEIIFINDGSADDGEKIVAEIAEGDRRVRLLNSIGRKGKGEALLIGTQSAQGEIIVWLDADLQHSPADLPRFLEKIRASADLVNGRRPPRRTLKLVGFYSRLFNSFLRLIFNSPFSDIGCGYKAFRRPVLERASLFPKMYRLFPLMAARQNYRMAEIAIENRPRLHGQSKFGAGKWLGGVAEIIRFSYWLARQ